MKGEIIPCLYAAGDACRQHARIGRAAVFGRIAGMHAANLKSGTGTEQANPNPFSAIARGEQPEWRRGVRLDSRAWSMPPPAASASHLSLTPGQRRGGRDMPTGHGDP